MSSRTLQVDPLLVFLIEKKTFDLLGDRTKGNVVTTATTTD